MQKAGGEEDSRGIKRSVAGAMILLFLDAAFSGSYLTSLLFCPVWFLVSLVRNAIQRPGWGLALVRIGIPPLTLALVMANDVIQRRNAEANAQRVVAACEEYHAANGEFPKKLRELVPRFMESVPSAKDCLSNWGQFHYYNNGKPLLVWYVVPPYLRRIYDFEERHWRYIE